jgi:hypothetical protein
MIPGPRFIQCESFCRLVQRKTMGDQKDQLLSVSANQLSRPGHVRLVGRGHRGDQVEILSEKMILLAPYLFSNQTASSPIGPSPTTTAVQPEISSSLLSA